MADKQILQVGKNCWRICRADRVCFLIDGKNYFKALKESLPMAEQQVMMLAWDIYSKLQLEPSNKTNTHTDDTSLGKMLDRLVRNKPKLHVNILSWDFSLLFAISREWLPIYKLEWDTHRRLKFYLDDQCPLGASHHQKVVVIDDALAFAGGLDLTRGRWDTQEHRADDLRRQTVDGGTALPIRPYHDVQVMVTGAAAANLGSLTRERWLRGTGNKLEAPEIGAQLWPTGFNVDMEDVDVAIVRTAPAYEGHSEIREVEQLYLDSIALAQDYIYIENQYFTVPLIADALAKRLAEDDGPEVILVLPLNTDGWLSQKSMDIMRVMTIKTLRDADKHKRFAVYYPHKPGLGELSINLHAKIMILDDCFVRVGSSNLNNRSMGLDTECDLAIEAREDQTAVMESIRHFRNRLLGEHLDRKPEVVNEKIKQQGSIIRGIEALRNEGRSLQPLEPHLAKADELSLEDIQLADPERPIDSDTLLKHFVPEKQTGSIHRRIVGWTITLLILIGLAASWRFTPLSEWLDIELLVELVTQWRSSSLTPLVVIAAFIIGGLLVMPVTAMIIVSVLVFEPMLGFFYAMAGSVISALVGYGLGSLLGRNAVRQLAGERINEISRQLAKRGFLTMLVVRIVPVAPFTIVNLVAGASHIRLRDFGLGTLFGMIPGVLAIALLTDRIEATLRSPDWQSLLTLILVATFILTSGYFLSRQLLKLAKNKTTSSAEQQHPHNRESL